MNEKKKQWFSKESPYLGLKSVPELVLQQPSYRVKVINTGGIGLRLDENGQVIDRIAPGAVAFEGQVRMACVGTTPYYGYKLNIMPHADRTSGMFHLRLIDMHPVQAVSKLPMAWNGNLRDPGVTDFQLSGCRLEFEKPAPFQIAGDAAGEVDLIDVKIDHPIRCATFAD